MRATALTAALFLLAPLHLAAQAQVSLSGRVLEFGTRSGISGASVSFPTVGTVTTNGNGDFRLPRMAPGERVVTISALGYQTRELRLNIQRDTFVVVELEVQALKIDSLRVQAHTITLRGKLTDPITKEPVFNADIAVANARTASSNMLGNFKVTRVPANVPVTLAVRAPGYTPFTTTISADRDTTLKIDLAIDEVGQRMLAAQAVRFDKRSHGVNASLTRYDRTALAFTRGETLGDFLKHHIFTLPRCFFADDIDRAGALPDILDSYLVDELDRVEVYDRGLMLRIYTRRYIAKQSINKPLPNIVYLRIGLGGRPVCM